MGILLHVQASPRGAASHSRRIGLSLVSQLEGVADLQVVTRDLACPFLPHPDQRFVGASLMLETNRGTEENEALAWSETLIGELEIADLVVIDTPMYNSSVPSVLKAWVDYVVRPGRTFRLTSGGKVGLLGDRPVYLVVACGGTVSHSDKVQNDYLTPYLCHALATIGLRDVSMLWLENLNRGTADLELAEKQAAAWISDRATDFKRFFFLGGRTT
jgi:FMN-dependent NADH-azoreductase